MEHDKARYVVISTLTDSVQELLTNDSEATLQDFFELSRNAAANDANAYFNRRAESMGKP
jgi:hypothetical protein